MPKNDTAARHGPLCLQGAASSASMNFWSNAAGVSREKVAGNNRLGKCHRANDADTEVAIEVARTVAPPPVAGVEVPEFPAEDVPEAPGQCLGERATRPHAPEL